MSIIISLQSAHQDAKAVPNGTDQRVTSGARNGATAETQPHISMQIVDAVVQEAALQNVLAAARPRGMVPVIYGAQSMAIAETQMRIRTKARVAQTV